MTIRSRDDQDGMEEVIPARGGPTGSAYLYTWDEHGQVTNIEPAPEDGRPDTATSNPRPKSTLWPFHSPSLQQPSRHSSNPLRSSIPSRLTRQPSAAWSSTTGFSFSARGRTISRSRPASSMLDSNIVPDYIVHFIRGETPETLAMKREKRMRHGKQNPLVMRGHHRQQDSLTADLFLGDGAAGGADGRGNRGWNTPRQVKGLLTGWRGGVALNAFLGFIILVVSIICLVLAAVDPGISGTPTTITSNSCDKIRNINLGIHVGVNVLGLVLLVGANYVYQVLTSPTRDEVDAAHKKQVFLDLGVPSWRNLGVISKGRMFLALAILVLAISSLIIYNSITFTTHHQTNCTLTLNGPLLGVLSILNLLTVLSLTLTLLIRPTHDPLVTLGDAISSFVADADTYTRNACLLTKADASTSTSTSSWETLAPRTYTRRLHRWYHTASTRRWILWLVSWLVPTVLISATLGVTISSNSSTAFTSFTSPTASYEFPSHQGLSSTAGLAIVTSLPQILLATLYLTTNGLLSSFYLSKELAEFANVSESGGIPLRVSSGDPLGAQTTSLYLTLPRPLSWLLFLTFVACSFMLSQGFFLTTTSSSSTPTPTLDINPLPLTILLAILILLLTTTTILSLRRISPSATLTTDCTPAGNPLIFKGGSCSAVLSSRCHRATPTETEDIIFTPLRWGVVDEEDAGRNDSIGIARGGDGVSVERRAKHAAFSGGIVARITCGQTYA